MDPRYRERLRPRMTCEERAKIFIPFDPLKGFREALREKELEAIESSKANEPFEESL